MRRGHPLQCGLTRLRRRRGCAHGGNLRQDLVYPRRDLVRRLVTRTRDDLTNDPFVMSQNPSPIWMTCCTTLGARESARVTACFPRSIRFARVTSCLRVNKGTAPHIAQVRPHGIEMFLGRGRAQIEFVHTHISAVAWSVIRFERRRLHERDAGLAKRVGEGLQVIRPR